MSNVKIVVNGLFAKDLKKNSEGGTPMLKSRRAGYIATMNNQLNAEALENIIDNIFERNENPRETVVHTGLGGMEVFNEALNNLANQTTLSENSTEEDIINYFDQISQDE